ncbi:calcium-activated potassium channel subunit beta-4 isoform 2 [Mus musculus]|uniref:calcium-activated potassium channel subunit beta-4 isoform 2 n=1 Tax=Mus musculus TaxID=10090 RepID=UPI00004717F6|nr:calcium-activated potassium channel subunit beta-4 isoform 2 [Mus musculus]|eukprot:XP_006513974.1 PREDICTED: calcium-activated potassium channel subunit beta-4 isoform X2 [Mus musculus]
MAKLRVSYEYTEAEDKSIRLGLFLIVSGILSLFIFGFCWLSPALQDLQATAANCTVLSVQQIGEVFECTFTCGTDCRGTSQYPCVQVYVNNSESNSRALLHSDQHQLLTNPKDPVTSPFMYGLFHLPSRHFSKCGQHSSSISAICGLDRNAHALVSASIPPKSHGQIQP